ncbi:MAG: DUF433 domain-containing protein [Planctomycetota bacterium]
MNPDRMSGTPCFYGTRVPVQHLFDYLKAGHTLDAFLDDFPGVTREQVESYLTFPHSGQDASGASPLRS